MASEHSWAVDLAKWAAGGTVGWFLNVLKNWKQAKKEKRQRELFLKGLPPEAKAILHEFYQKGTHTLRCDPGSPPMRLLMSLDCAERGPGGGTYDAIDCYVTLSPRIWQAMEESKGQF